MNTEKAITAFFAFLLLINFSSSYYLTEIIAENTTSNKSGISLDDSIKNSSVSLREETNRILESNITFSPALKEIAKLAFGIKQNKQVSIQNLVVLASLWVMLLLVVRQILEFTPFFTKNWMQWAGGVIITALAGASGGLQQTSRFFFDIASFIFPLRNWKLLQLGLSLIILVLFFIGITKITSLIKNKIGIALAEEKGRKIAEGAKSAEVFSKGIKDLASH